VSCCATCDAAFYRGRHVALVGSNEQAAEEALYLAKLADHVSQYRIMSLPTLNVYMGGQVVAQKIGFTPKNQLQNLVDGILATR
jgi:alkyl hydroperoxide reductase subunit AhpF